MKIPQAKNYIATLTVAALVIGAGGMYAADTFLGTQNIASAYTSPENPQDPATAPASYVVNIPDANLKAALNAFIAAKTGTTRGAADNITAGEMRAPYMAAVAGNPTLMGKGITNIEGLQFLTNTTLLYLNNNAIIDATPLKDLTKLTQIHLQNNQLQTLPSFANLSNLVSIDVTRNQLSSLAQLSNLPKLKTLSAAINKITSVDGVVSTLPALETFNASANKLTSLNAFVGHPKITSIVTDNNEIADIANLTQNAPATLKTLYVRGQNTLSVTTNTAVLANPLKAHTASKTVTPITETTTVKMANSDGTLNANGDHLKLNAAGAGTTAVNFATKEAHPTITTAFSHSGKLTINYNLDAVAPTFDQNPPAKITSRKAVVINLNDVTAQDNPGGSGISPAGVTHNAAAQGLDPANPAPGAYVITYSVSDNANNTVTVNRDVEITDADALQAKVNSVNPALLDGRTPASVAEVNTKKAAAEAVIGNTGATQAQIDQALNDLQVAIDALETSNEPIDQALATLQTKPDYIRNEAGVFNAANNANTVKNDPARTPAAVRQAAQQLLDAITAAENDEATRQAAAERAVADAEAAKGPATFVSAQIRIDAVKDPAVRQRLQDRLNAVRNTYNDKRAELNQLIARAEQPETTDGMTADSVQDFNDELADIKASNIPNINQATVQSLINRMRDAFDALVVDKQPLRDALQLESTQPEYIKQNPAVVAAVSDANATNNNGNATVADVRTKAAALRQAIQAAVNAENQAQTAADTALDAAEAALNDPALGQDDMPNIDFADLTAKVNAVQDPAQKQMLQDRLTALRRAFDTRKAGIDARRAQQGGSNPAQPGQPGSGQLGQTGAKPTQAARRGLAETGEGALAWLVGGFAVTMGGLVAAVRRLRK